MAKSKQLSGFEQMMEDIRTGNHNGGLLTINVNSSPNTVLGPILTYLGLGKPRNVYEENQGEDYGSKTRC